MLHLKVLSITAAFVAFLFFAIPAQADEIEPEPAAEPAPEPEPEPEPEPVRARDDDYARNGAYIGVNMAGAWYTDVHDDVKDLVDGLAPVNPWSGTRVDVEYPLGLGARAGYRFHPRLAGELEFQWFSKAKVELDDDQSTVNAIKIETLTLMGNVKGYLFTGRVQPFVLAGVGFMHLNGNDKLSLGVETSGDEFAARFGGGVDLYVNRNFVVVVEGGYVLPTGDLDNLNQVIWSVGLQYRF